MTPTSRPPRFPAPGAALAAVPPDDDAVRDPPAPRTPPPAAPDWEELAAQGSRRPEPLPAALADRYEVVRELGRGGMGVVRLARDRRLGRLVAIKSIRSDAGAALTSRFRAEAETVARLEHPHIIRLYEVEADGRQTCLILEHVGGGTLAGRLARGPLVPRAAAALLADLAGAVRYAHERGVVHRDLKPANILLDDRPADTAAARPPAPKIADFGLAKRADRVDPRCGGNTNHAGDDATCHTGLLVGTPSYMAPEQAARDDRSVGPAADVYALGAVLYECLTGRPPFQAASAAETLDLVRSRDPVPVRHLQPVVPRDLETIALKCLQKDPVRRYASAADLGEDLGRFLRGEPVRARPVGVVVRLAKAARRRPAWAALVIVVSLAVAGGVTGVLVYDANLRWALGLAAAGEARAVRQQARTEANYRSARDAVRRMLRRLEDRNVAGVPRLKELQRQQMEDALAFFRDVVRLLDDPTPEVRADVAQAWYEAGRLQYELGQVAEAGESYRRADELYAGLVGECPTVPRYRVGRASVLSALGSWCATRKEFDDSLPYVRTSVALWEALVREEPSSAEFRSGLAAAELNLGNQYAHRQNYAEAEPYYRAAADLRSALTDADPRRENRRALAECLLNLSVAYQNSNRPADALACYERAAAEFDRLTRTDPLDSYSVMSLAVLRVNRSYVLSATGRREEAAAGLAPSIAALEELLRREPESAVARDRLIRARGTRAQLLGWMGRHAEAVPDWERVVALDADPPRSVNRVFLAQALARGGNPARAVTEVEDMAAQAGVPALHLHCLAAAAATAADALAKDDRVSPGEKAPQVERAAALAVGLLERAAEGQGAEVRAYRTGLAADDDFRPLRDRADFRRLTQPGQPPEAPSAGRQ